MGEKFIIYSSAVACLILYIVEQILMADYLTKTSFKILLFLLIPIIYMVQTKKEALNRNPSINIFKKGNLNLGLLFGTVSFAVIIAAYLLIGNSINISDIVNELQNKSKITPANFIFVGLYITFGNSLLEEFFFRGFIFLKLYGLNYKKTAYIYSSLLFGLYHIAIFKTWFSIWLIGLAMIGLVSIGFIFDWLDTRSNNFINSWIVHILADSAIIIIGLSMFKMI